MVWVPQRTDDGSYTFFSESFGEAFHTLNGAQQEAIQKFAHATALSERAKAGQLNLLDVCYGLGYNSAAALEASWASNPTCQVRLHGLELDPSVPVGAIAPAMLACWAPETQEILTAIALTHHCTTARLQADLHIGDARHTIQTLVQEGFQADAIFFDPFSPRRCPQLWTVEFFSLVARCLKPEGRLATYSRSASVRAALQSAGLQIGTIPLGPADPEQPRRSHEWSQGTVAAHTAAGLHPLSPLEQEHLQTRAAVPFRDPALNDSAEAILERHQQEQQHSTLESTTSWRRRWGIQ